MFNSRGNEEAIALLEDDVLVYDKDPHLGRSNATSRLSLWIVVLSFALLAADVLLCFYIFRVLSSTPNPQLDINALPLRNSYVGLADLYRLGKVNASRYDPIINTPRIAAQISVAEPKKVFPEDEHRHLGSFGTLSPPDRHLRVSAEIHTILQFRVMDFGMERCALTLRLPPTDAALPEPFVFGSGDGSIPLNICALDALPLDVRALSWERRPLCSREIGVVVADADREVAMPEFPCSWGTLHTYEVSCVNDSPECVLDVWSNKYATWGFFIRQFQTI